MDEIIQKLHMLEIALHDVISTELRVDELHYLYRPTIDAIVSLAQPLRDEIQKLESIDD